MRGIVNNAKWKNINEFVIFIEIKKIITQELTIYPHFV